jgi:hypothetical protein
VSVGEEGLKDGHGFLGVFTGSFFDWPLSYKKLIDKTFKTMKGARVSFSKSFSNRKHKSTRAEWSKLYQPGWKRGHISSGKTSVKLENRSVEPGNIG